MAEFDPLIVAFAHINEPLPAAFADFPTPQNKPLAALSERERRKWQSRRLASFLLHQLFEKLNLDQTQLTQIIKTESGRPYFSNSTFDFNISHSGDWIAVILSAAKNKKAVGIDIEHPQKVRRYWDLLKYYAPEKEIAEIKSAEILPELTSLEDRFYLSWCLREAVLKSQGVGIVKLAEVQHSLREQTITSAHCPTGKLCFFNQLPFYLAHFFEQSPSVLSLPPLFQWHNGDWVEITQLSPIIYHVN